MALAPAEPLALNYLGYAQAERRVDVPASIAMLQRAHAAKPDDASIADGAVSGGGGSMSITADGKELWVTQRFLRRVAIVDLAQMKVVASIPVGKSPHGLFILKGTATPAAGAPIRAASTEGEAR